MEPQRVGHDWWLNWTELNDLNGLPGRLNGKESSCQFRRHGFNPWVQKTHRRRKGQPTPVFSSVQSLIRVQFFATPWISACQASLSITNSRSSLRLMPIDSVMPSSHLILGRPLLLLPPILPASESFPMTQLFAWGGQSTGVSALASFLPKKSQGWTPSEWTGWIFLQSKGLSRVFSNTTLQNHQFFGTQFSSQSKLTSIHDHWKKQRLD